MTTFIQVEKLVFFAILVPIFACNWKEPNAGKKIITPQIAAAE